MKILIIIFISIILVKCSYGQNPVYFDSSGKLKHEYKGFGSADDRIYGAGDTIPTGYLTLGGHWRSDSMPTKYDTIPCIMLVCDTSNSLSDYVYSDGTKVQYLTFISEARWMFGNFVINSGAIRGTYLDADKKPLEKSIIVWQSINRK